MEKVDIHIGKLIKSKLAEDGRSVVWFADKLHCDSSNIYRIFQKQWIDNEQLLDISLILGYDFFTTFSDYIAARKEKR
ncbi:hypothetical protein SAMD00024442_59_2 [Candidatus Symbiothrix dinenymphae]|nr:hypothetical protein SAMD00024442_59_2 [Candidatus Symbiothrix dinenymphae]